MSTVTSSPAIAPAGRFAISKSRSDGPNVGAAWGAAFAIVAGAARSARLVSPRQAALYGLGAVMGLVLYHAAFGFTSAWRVFIADGRGAGLRAQMVDAGRRDRPVLSGPGVRLLLRPAGGWAGLAGGHFGAGRGLHLRRRHADGRRLRVGHALHGGRRLHPHADHARGLRGRLDRGRGASALVVGAAQLRTGFAREAWGAWPALAANWAVFAAIAGVTILVERRRRGALETPSPSPRTGLARFARGPGR